MPARKRTSIDSCHIIRPTSSITTFATSTDLAFANMLHLDSGTRKNGLQTAIWVRSSVCCRRSNGKWLITHEHISVPINPQNLQAWFPPGYEPA